MIRFNDTLINVEEIIFVETEQILNYGISYREGTQKKFEPSYKVNIFFNNGKSTTLNNLTRDMLESLFSSIDYKGNYNK